MTSAEPPDDDTPSGVIDTSVPEPNWEALLGKFMAEPVGSVRATTFHLGPWHSASRPVCVKCDDGVFRVIKGMQAGGRMLFNDQAVARLAQLIGAPVPKPAIVNLPAELIALEPRLAHMPAGLCHGSEFYDGHSDRQTVAFESIPENRPRFARLAILYGWVHASDHQQIYPNAPPHLVLSVDHGHFIGDGGPSWAPDTLERRGPAHQDQIVTTGAKLSGEELRNACLMLQGVTAQQIAEAVAASPSGWGIALEDRTAFARYLWRRRSELISSLIPAAAAVSLGA